MFENTKIKSNYMYENIISSATLQSAQNCHSDFAGKPPRKIVLPTNR